MNITHLSFYLLFCLSCSYSLQSLLSFFTYVDPPITELLLKEGIEFISIPSGFSCRKKEQCVRKDVSFFFLISWEEILSFFHLLSC